MRTIETDKHIAAVMKHVKAGEEAVNGVENGGIFKFYSRGTAGSSLFEVSGSI